MNSGDIVSKMRGWAFLSSDTVPYLGKPSTTFLWEFHHEPRNVRKVDHIDFFISYRRDGGSTIARLLYEVLRLRGLSGFIDAEKLEQGDYGDAIYRNIEKAKNFILVVSPGALDSEWVVKEIEAAIMHGRKIVPIFTSGVTCFPDNLPPNIAVLSKENAISLDHSNFEIKYKQLVDWLETPHVKLVNACFKQWSISTDSVDEVFAAWKSISGDSEVLNTIAPQLKKAWQSSSDESTTRRVLKSIGTTDLKKIAQEVGVEPKGNRSTLLNVINDRLRGNACFSLAEDRGYELEGERYYRVCAFVASMFKSGEKLAELKALVTQMNLCPENWRSSQALMEALFDSPEIDSVNEVFDVLPLDTEEIKSVCANFCEQEGRSLAAIRANFEAWVDYADRFDAATRKF